MEEMSNAGYPRKPPVSVDSRSEAKDADVLERISSNNPRIYQMNRFFQNENRIQEEDALRTSTTSSFPETSESSVKIPSRENFTDVKCQSKQEDTKSMSKSTSNRIQEEDTFRTTTINNIPESPVKEARYSKRFSSFLRSFDSPLYAMVSMLMVGMHTLKSQKRRPIPKIVLTSPEGTETTIELPPTPPPRYEATPKALIPSSIRKKSLHRGPLFQPEDFIHADFQKGLVIQRGMYQSGAVHKEFKSRPEAKSRKDAMKPGSKHQQDSILQSAKSLQRSKSKEEADELHRSLERPCSREISVSSSTTTTTSSEDFEYKSCGGFKLPSPEKRFQPPRNPFAIPETFETAPASSPAAYDFGPESFGPDAYVFPSLIFGPDTHPERDTRKQRTEDLYRCNSNSQLANFNAVVDAPVDVFADTDSSKPQNDTHLPKSIFNPKNLHFPYSYGDGFSENPDRLSLERRSDPLSGLCSEAMKEFENVYGQYVHSLEKRVLRKLESMRDFITAVRKATSVVTRKGAIVSTMDIPYDVRSGIRRINELIGNLTCAKERFDNVCKYCYWMYLNLKHRPLNNYWKGNGASRLDEINALKNKTKEMSDWLTHAIRIIDSYPVLKRHVERYVFKDSSDDLSKLKGVLKHEEFF